MEAKQTPFNDDQTLVAISVEDQVIAISDARDECSRVMSESNQVTSHLTVGNYCSATWDGLMCWPSTRAGETAELQCAWYVNRFYIHAKASRQCMDSGEWFVHSEKNSSWTNYTSCRTPDLLSLEVPPVQVSQDHMQRIKLMYSTGYGISLLALGAAIFIMLYFRRLHCPRNTIHLNLFTAFVLRGVLSFLKDNLLVSHLGLPGDLLEVLPGHYIFDPKGTHWQCKLLLTTFHYIQLASSAWVLVEGLYLYILVTVTLFSERRYTRWCTVMGWGCPLLFLLPWVTVRVTFEDELCWNTHPTQGYFWILKGPQMAVAVLNFIFFLNIVRVLFTKLVRCATPKARTYRYRRLGKSTLVLIPIFGVHYLVTMGIPENRSPVLETIKLYFEMFFNSFQGLLIACLFCFMNGEVQTEIRKRYIRYKLRVNSRNHQNKYMTTASSQLRARTVPSTSVRPESRGINSSSESDQKLFTERQKIKMQNHPKCYYRSQPQVTMLNDIIFTNSRNSYV